MKSCTYSLYSKSPETGVPHHIRTKEPLVPIGPEPNARRFLFVGAQIRGGGSRVWSTDMRRLSDGYGAMALIFRRGKLQ
jgi:hypothetical protein